MASRELQLVAVGNITHQLLKELESPIHQVLGVEPTLGKATLPPPVYAFNKERAQYHSSSIMRRALTVKEPGMRSVLAVLDVDLFVPDTPFIFGEADREQHVAVLSTFRLRGEGEGWKRRFSVEGVHQAGHLIGLSFCEDTRCAMFAATTVAEAERRQLSLCNNCRNELVKQRR